MKQLYTHDHIEQAHHSGITIGAIAGACTVLVVLVLAAAIKSPSSLFDPGKLVSLYSGKDSSVVNASQGAVSSYLTSNDRPTFGGAAVDSLPYR